MADIQGKHLSSFISEMIKSEESINNGRKRNTKLTHMVLVPVGKTKDLIHLVRILLRGKLISAFKHSISLLISIRRKLLLNKEKIIY